VYSSTQNYLTDVGAFSGSAGFYGTFDMNGNVYQWNDLDGTANASRGVIGGFWFGGPNSASNTTVASQAAIYEGSDVGFRLASPVPVPEPSTWVMGVGGLACAAWAARQRRARA
jgi:formylglycine-generating enzyme required for sulfatase activity